jgi:hypothetical protein
MVAKLLALKIPLMAEQRKKYYSTLRAAENMQIKLNSH